MCVCHVQLDLFLYPQLQFIANITFFRRAIIVYYHCSCYCTLCQHFALPIVFPLFYLLKNQRMYLITIHSLAVNTVTLIKSYNTSSLLRYSSHLSLFISAFHSVKQRWISTREILPQHMIELKELAV